MHKMHISEEFRRPISGALEEKWRSVLAELSQVAGESERRRTCVQNLEREVQELGDRASREAESAKSEIMRLRVNIEKKVIVNIEKKVIVISALPPDCTYAQVLCTE